METPDRRARISDFKSLLLKSLFLGPISLIITTGASLPAATIG